MFDSWKGGGGAGVVVVVKGGGGVLPSLPVHNW